MIKKILFFTILVASSLLSLAVAFGQAKTKSPAEAMAATVMTIWKDSLVMQPGKPVKWAYDEGVVTGRPHEYLAAYRQRRIF